jgi:hypothetical protein
MIALALAVAYWLGGGRVPDGPLEKEVLKGTAEAATLVGILTGFLGGLVGVIFSLPDRPLINGLRETNGFRLIVRYVISALNAGFLAVVYGLALSVAASLLPSELVPKFVVVWIFLLALALATFYRSVRISALLLSRAASPTKNKSARPPRRLSKPVPPVVSTESV